MAVPHRGTWHIRLANRARERGISAAPRAAVGESHGKERTTGKREDHHHAMPARLSRKSAIWMRLLLLALASGGECKRTGRGPASCQGRCACLTFRAHASLKRMQLIAETCATSAESGIVDRSELNDATNAASSAVDSIREMRATCAAACARGCRGCRVSRLLNQTKALQEGVDGVVEMGTFVDDE